MKRVDLVVYKFGSEKSKTNRPVGAVKAYDPYHNNLMFEFHAMTYPRWCVQRLMSIKIRYHRYSANHVINELS